MKQTAVEWLVEQIENYRALTRESAEKVINQARQMEIEQIRRAFCHGEVARDRIDSMEYYNETYGK
jgi:methyl coenzyme M reductase subunit D